MPANPHTLKTEIERIMAQDQNKKVSETISTNHLGVMVQVCDSSYVGK
jgi:hypothetical protein